MLKADPNSPTKLGKGRTVKQAWQKFQQNYEKYPGDTTQRPARFMKIHGSIETTIVETKKQESP